MDNGYVAVPPGPSRRMRFFTRRGPTMGTAAKTGKRSSPSSGKCRYPWCCEATTAVIAPKTVDHEITDASPAKVALTLDMIKPMKGHNEIEFILEPMGGNSTTVTWAMRGSCPFFVKVMGLFFNMDRMIGKDFEAGLASLKAGAEG